MMIKRLFNRLFFSLVLVTVLTACGHSQEEKAFRKALQEGNLTEAEAILESFAHSPEGRRSALVLINTYLDVDRPDLAINVYENITPFHSDRYNMGHYPERYEYKACASIRSYLVKHGQYEKAWKYYPLKYSTEDYYGNAESRANYISDVVTDLCMKGRNDEAIQFINLKTSWFSVHVDPILTKRPEMAAYSSESIRQLLLDLVNNSTPF